MGARSADAVAQQLSGPGAPVLLYDGECGLCARSVQFVLGRDPAGSLRFAPLQGAFASGVRHRHPSLHTLQSMIWVEPARAPQPERVFVRSAAALRVARYLGGWWRLALVAHAIPAFLRDAVYDLVAAHRHALVGGACFVPRPAERGRFLE